MVWYIKSLHRIQSSTATAQPPNSEIQSENTVEDWTDIREWMDSDFVNWVLFMPPRCLANST